MDHGETPASLSRNLMPQKAHSIFRVGLRKQLSLFVGGQASVTDTSVCSLESCAQWLTGVKHMVLGLQLSFFFLFFIEVPPLVAFDK